jgi:serine/threonine protein kinase
VSPLIARSQLGPYELQRRLAVGGTSEIFLAHLAESDGPTGLTIGDTVVVKRPLPHVLEDPVFRALFEREIILSRELCHPGIVRGIDSGNLENGEPFLVLEHIPGRSLRSVIAGLQRDETQAPPEVAAAVGAQLCAALSLLHGLRPPFPCAGVLVHRDVHPANIVVQDSGRVVLVDLGLAGPGSEALPPGAGHWSSPELQRGAPAGPQSDLYSVGRVVQALLLGSLGDQESPRSETGSDLWSCVARCLTEEPGERPSSAVAVRTLLRETLGEQGPELLCTTVARWLQSMEQP